MNIDFVVRNIYSIFRPRASFYHSVKEYSLNRISRGEFILVSLTSFPARIKTVSYTIETILNQRVKPDDVILWLAEEQFPRKEKELPHRLLRLKEYGLKICWCKDIRSYKKLIPTLQMYSDKIIVTADDDVYYPPNWMEQLYQSYKLDKECIHCHRGHPIEIGENGEILSYDVWGKKNAIVGDPTYRVLMTGVGGVLYPPNCFYEDICDEKLFKTLAPDADDFWFWTMALLKGSKIKVVSNNINDFEGVFSPSTFSLWGGNSMGNNDKVLSNLCKHYPLLLERIK